MALLPKTLGATDKQTENIYTSQQQLGEPGKVSKRPVEVVQKEPDYDAMQKSIDFAKSQAVTGSVGSNSLVQNQLNTILSSGSPLLKQARNNSAMASAERGLNNSSIAVQAGEEAAIASALPIAQQDAGTYANMDLTNLNAQNNFGSQGLGQVYSQQNQRADQAFTSGENEKSRDFTAGESAAERQARSDLQSADQTFQAGENKTGRDFTAEQNQLSDDRNLQGNKELSQQNFEQSQTMEQLQSKNNLAMEDIRFEYSQVLNSSATANAIYQNHAQSVANIMSQPNMTPSQAGAAIQVLNQTTKDNLALAGALSGVDLSGYAPSSSVSGTSTTDKKGNVTNTFNANQASTTGSTEQADAPSSNSASKEAWLSEVISVTRPGTLARFGSVRMTRAEAIKKGYIKDDYKS